MSLEIYRRHHDTCRVHKLKLTPSQKRHFRDCDCWIWLVGKTDASDYPRQTTKLKDWAGAEALVRSLEAESKDIAVHGVTISDSIQRFLDGHKENVGTRAFKEYRLLLTRLEAFAKSRGLYHMKDLNVDVLEDFKTYGLPEIKKSTTKSTVVSKLKYFLREAYRRGWTTEALAEKVKSTKAVYEQKQPYSDDEVATILEHTQKLNGGTSGYATNGKTFRLLIELMIETGMRVSDAIRYDPTKCSKSKHLWIYKFTPTKQKKNEKAKQAEVFLTEKLKLAIDECDWFSETLPFAYRKFGDNTAMEAAVYERMQAIGERSGVEDCRPHRLRDTFAVRMLLRDIALEDVSKLLCHSSIAVTEKYYAAWIPSRKLRLEALMAKALVNSVSN